MVFVLLQVSPVSCSGPLITGDLLSEEQKVSNPSEECLEEELKVPDLVIENQVKEEPNVSNSEEEELVEEKLFDNSYPDNEFKCNNTNSESFHDGSFGDHVVKVS